MIDMQEGFKQLVPSEVCLSCEGCCRFPDAKSEWRPRTAVEERAAAGTAAEQENVLSEETVDADGYINAVPYEGKCCCAFLAVEDNTCKIYNDRPFECQIYPFVLMKNKGQAELTVHLCCPYIQDAWDTEKYQQYLCYLKDYFAGEDILSFLKRNPSLCGDYSECQNELETVVVLDNLR